MAHRSENSEPLSERRLDVRNWNDLLHIDGAKENVYIFHFDTETPYSLTETDDISFNTERFFSKLSDECVICFIVSSENALNLIPRFQKSLFFKLWISIRRDKPVVRECELPNNHIGLVIFTKYKTSLAHCKTRIAYTCCPACKKTTKDYGGKKHLYSPYGTLMSDVWRDITYQPDIFPSGIIERLRDLFGLPPYKIVNYIDLRQLTGSKYDRNAEKKDVAKNFAIADPGESRLVNADCFKAFKEMPDNSVDFAFADPPYNIKKKYQNWDDAIDIREYFRWCDKWLDELARIVRPGRTVAVINIPLWLVRHFQHIKYKLDFQSWITWEALGLPVRKIMPAHYCILCMSKGKARGAVGVTEKINWDTRYLELNMLKQWYCNRKSCANLRNSAKITDREALTDLWWDIHRLKHNSNRVDHPCQLPPQLMRRLIALYTLEGECVLDPFNGAGTTTLVARELGRRFIGFELSENYHKIALDRHHDLESGADPFAKRKCTPDAKNSRVKRLKKQKYAVPKKTLQLEVKRIAGQIGRVPTREDVKKHSKHPFSYYEEYFADWGEVCSAVGDKGMKEESDTEYEEPGHKQLALFERLGKYELKSARLREFS
ncbi:DNA methyltransferase [Desulfobacterales bacterium HSG2]|nr:DNA methyltransferase [Desulfobacterales bacterium HSG2]